MDLGTWNAGVPATFDFKSSMEGELELHPKRMKYRIVTVHQPPIMYYNQETGRNRVRPICYIKLPHSQIVLRDSPTTFWRR